MKQFVFCLIIVFLLAGIAAADPPDTTITDTTTPGMTSESGRSGGSIFFETHPSGAMIWLDNQEMGTSDFTYYSQTTGTFEVLVRKKGYEEYRGTVTVSEGKRVVFSAILTPVSHTVMEENTPVIPVTTITTIKKSTLTLPTPWPTSQQAPLDPAAAVAAGAISLIFFVIRQK